MQISNLFKDQRFTNAKLKIFQLFKCYRYIFVYMLYNFNTFTSSLLVQEFQLYFLTYLCDERVPNSVHRNLINSHRS
jgi:hypothetical protein